MHVCACTRPRARVPTRTHSQACTHRPICNTYCFSTATMFRERASMLRYAYIVCLVYFMYDIPLHDLGDRRGYSHLKEEALDRIKWRNRFGRGCGPVVRQITDEWMNSSPSWLYVTLPHFSHNRLSWSSPSFSCTTVQNCPSISELLSVASSKTSSNP
jgi:hypothetical protein